MQRETCIDTATADHAQPGKKKEKTRNYSPQVPKTTGDSSPGNLTPGGHPSKGDWQIPQTSSSVPFPTFQVHLATAWYLVMRTRSLVFRGPAAVAAAEGEDPAAAIAEASSPFVLLLLLLAIGVSLERLRDNEGVVPVREKDDMDVMVSGECV